MTESKPTKSNTNFDLKCSTTIYSVLFTVNVLFFVSNLSQLSLFAFSFQQNSISKNESKIYISSFIIFTRIRAINPFIYCKLWIDNNVALNGSHAL